MIRCGPTQPETSRQRNRSGTTFFPPKRHKDEFITHCVSLLVRTAADSSRKRQVLRGWTAVFLSGELEWPQARKTCRRASLRSAPHGGSTVGLQLLPTPGSDVKVTQSAGVYKGFPIVTTRSAEGACVRRVALQSKTAMLDGFRARWSACASDGVPVCNQSVGARCLRTSLTRASRLCHPQDRVCLLRVGLVTLLCLATAILGSLVFLQMRHSQRLSVRRAATLLRCDRILGSVPQRPPIQDAPRLHRVIQCCF